MHRLTENHARRALVMEVQPRYQAAALRRLAHMKICTKIWKASWKAMNEKLADIAGRTARPNLRRNSCSPSKSPLKRRSQYRPTEFPNPSVVFFIRKSPEPTAGYRSLCSLCARFAVFRIE